MTRFAVLAVLAILAASCATVPPAKAAPLLIAGSAPLFDNANACGASALLSPQPPTNANLRIVLTWSGPVSGRDSVYVQPGAAFSFVKALPSGTYTCLVHATDLGGAGCDTTLVRVVKAPPHSVAVN